MAASGPPPGLVPELDVTNLDVSLAFYVELLGFEVSYDRPAERFAYLVRTGAALMLEEAAGPGRRFRTASLETPFGRGMNFQLEVEDVDTIHARLVAHGHEPVIALEDRWYDVGSDAPMQAGNRQFVVADPDGYLWRPFQDIGTRPRLDSARP